MRISQRKDLLVWMRWSLVLPLVGALTTASAILPSNSGRILLDPELRDPRTVSEVPRPIFQARPVWPQHLRAAMIEVGVVLEFIVNTEGRISHAYAVRSTNPWFERPALEALVQWRFHPGRVDGRPVNTRMQVPIIFSMNGITKGGWTLLLPGDPSKLPVPLRYDVPPVAIHSTYAVYPTASLRERRAATVRVQIVLNEEGEPVRIHVPPDVPTEFAGSSRAMVGFWRFKPAERDGKPTPTAIALDVVFSPDGEGAAPVSNATKNLLAALEKGKARIVPGEELDGRPEPLVRHEAMYPVELKADGQGGRAVIECYVGPDGEVMLPEVVEASHPAFGYAAVQALATWWFRPPMRGGKPVTVRLRVPFDFKVD